MDLNLIEISDKIKNTLISIGFSEEEADSQLEDLSEIIISAFVQKVPDKSQLKNSDEIRQIFFETATPIVTEYLQNISQRLDEDAKKKLFDQINSLSDK